MKKNGSYKNLGGIKDFTCLEVDMAISRDFRETEYVEGHAIKCSYKAIPKTCYSCKQPGSRCPTGGTASYSCKMRKPEVDWEIAYNEEEDESTQSGH